MTKVENQSFDNERALYGLKNAEVKNCVFSGPADGESPIKEGKGVSVLNCRFDLRYPMWHCTKLGLVNSELSSTCRAAIWYAKNVAVSGCKLNGIKMFRECENVSLSGCDADSAEMFWKCKNIAIAGSDVNSEYFMLESKNIAVSNLMFTGKYSFQYVKNVTVADSVLDTKDAFWHAENVKIKNCTVKGEYLGWYSKNLTFENCKIEGTQPFCYCNRLTLINCTMENCDLSFEYSSVKADIKGNIPSVKNVKSGEIVADSIGEVILENSVITPKCKIITRE